MSGTAVRENLTAEAKICNQKQERTDCKSGKPTSMEVGTESRKPGLQSVVLLLQGKLQSEGRN